MEILSFLHDEPVMAWFALLALLLIIVPIISVLWRRLAGHQQDISPKQPEQTASSTHFGNRIELALLLVAALLSLALIGAILRALFG